MCKTVLHWVFEHILQHVLSGSVSRIFARHLLEVYLFWRNHSMDLDCGSKNGCFKSLPTVSLLRHRDFSDVSARLKVFSWKVVSRFGLARWGEKMWDRNGISDWFWLPTLGKNMPVFVFFPIFALDSPQIWTHHAVVLLFEVQWVAQARSQIMTRSVNMVHSIVVFESFEIVFQSLWHITCSMPCCLKTWLTFVFMCLCMHEELLNVQCIY